MGGERVVLEPVGSSVEEVLELIRYCRRRGFARFLRSDREAERGPDGSEYLERREGSITEPGGRVVPIVNVQSQEDVDRAVEAGRTRGAVVVTWTTDRVIPLENLIARAQGRFSVWVRVDRLRDLSAMLGALEQGADRLLIEIRTPADVDRIESALDRVAIDPIPWELATVSRVAPAGQGDRVLVDTTSMLGPGEGILVGSAAAFLFHVRSEAIGSRFSNPRPFRVNAGAAHSYALLADGSTRYLSELSPGDPVLAAEAGGPGRSVRVGRIKIERRPLILVEVRRGDRAFTVFLQEAETVRLTAEAAGLPATEIAEGARIYAVPLPPARHLGGVVHESIEER